MSTSELGLAAAGAVEPTAAAPSVAASPASVAVAAPPEVANSSGAVTVPVFESEELTASISPLKREQKDMRAARKKLTKDLKNAEKRRTRLKKRARQLSDADLVAVLQMRGSVPSQTSDAANSTSAASTPARTGASEGEHSDL